jgi:hypothetical protein
MLLQAFLLVFACLFQGATAINASPIGASSSLVITPAITTMAHSSETTSLEDPACWTYPRPAYNPECAAHSPDLNCARLSTITSWSTISGPLDSCPTTQTVNVPTACQTACENPVLRTEYIRTYSSYLPGCFTASSIATAFEKPQGKDCPFIKCRVDPYWTLVPPHNPACPTTVTVTQTKRLPGCTACPTYTSTSTEEIRATKMVS